MCQRYRTEPVRDQEDKELMHHLYKTLRNHANGLNALLNPFALPRGRAGPCQDWRGCGGGSSF
ncbi:hypothetical protein CN593_05350 [Bacillus pseudomycoides]|nr:hypothetical protein CN593_05350 [Bacillus pseudomycoides]